MYSEHHPLMSYTWISYVPLECLDGFWSCIHTTCKCQKSFLLTSDLTNKPYVLLQTREVSNLQHLWRHSSAGLYVTLFAHVPLRLWRWSYIYFAPNPPTEYFLVACSEKQGHKTSNTVHRQQRTWRKSANVLPCRSVLILRLLKVLFESLNTVRSKV
jgi:hypothetical protein